MRLTMPLVVLEQAQTMVKINNIGSQHLKPHGTKSLKRQCKEEFFKNCPP